VITLNDIEESIKDWETQTNVCAEDCPYSLGGQALETMNVLKTLYFTIKEINDISLHKSS
jgi:hypothetical protein